MMDPNNIYQHELQNTTLGTFVTIWNIEKFDEIDATTGKSLKTRSYHHTGTYYVGHNLELFVGGENSKQSLTSLYVLCRNTRKNLFAKISILFCRSDGFVFAERHHDWTVYNCKRRYAGPPGLSRDLILQNIAVDKELVIRTEVTYTHSNIRVKVAEIEKRFSIPSPAAFQIDAYENMIKTTRKDVVIRCGEQNFHIHRSVLIGWSSVFAEKLLHDSTGVIEESDFGPNVVRSLIDFLYHGKLVCIDVTLAANLILIGHKYDIAGLKNYCFRFLAAVSPGTFEDNVENVRDTLCKLQLSPELALELTRCLNK